jgi:hypothetical protein
MALAYLARIVSSVALLAIALEVPLSACAQESGAFVNEHATEFDVRSGARARLSVTKVVTVTEARGRDQGILQVYYDRELQRIRTFEGELRDARGKVIRKLRKDDIIDDAVLTAGTLYDGWRVRIGTLVHDAFPYTVSYSYEVDYDGISHWPTWRPQETEAAVLLAEFRIVAPEGMPIRYRAQNLDLEPTVSTRSGRTTYQWTATAMPPFESEPWGPSFSEQVPSIYTAPDDFQIEGYRGSMGSWAGLSEWYTLLGKGRDEVPPALRAEVEALVAGVGGIAERARVVYRFMQERTRYVSVQLGIGGWQPNDVVYVDKNRFGDCKALVNYTQALLRVVGVDAYPALIRSGVGAPEVPADFPCNPFNHVVLYVPNHGDPLWLECTSQTMPFGRIGAANENRWALVAFPGGGKLMRTPSSSSDENFQNRTAHVGFTATGDATAVVETRFGGNQQERVRASVLTSSGPDRERWLRGQIALPAYELTGVSFDGIEAGMDRVSLSYSLTINKYGRKTGSRMFIRPYIIEHPVSVPPPAERERTQPVTFGYRFADTDSVMITLPAGYEVEALPSPVDLETSFGRFASEVTVQDDGSLSYVRYLEISETSVPASVYEEVRNFFSTVAAADRTQAVLVRP